MSTSQQSLFFTTPLLPLSLCPSPLPMMVFLTMARDWERKYLLLLGRRRDAGRTKRIRRRERTVRKGDSEAKRERDWEWGQSKSGRVERSEGGHRETEDMTLWAELLGWFLSSSWSCRAGRFWSEENLQHESLQRHGEDHLNRIHHLWRFVCCLNMCCLQSC